MKNIDRQVIARGRYNGETICEVENDNGYGSRYRTNLDRFQFWSSVDAAKSAIDDHKKRTDALQREIDDPASQVRTMQEVTAETCPDCIGYRTRIDAARHSQTEREQAEQELHDHEAKVSHWFPAGLPALDEPEAPLGGFAPNAGPVKVTKQTVILPPGPVVKEALAQAKKDRAETYRKNREDVGAWDNEQGVN